MRTKLKQLGLVTACLLLLEMYTIVSMGSSDECPDLTGLWYCDDGATYYISQIGDTVQWYGENNPTTPDFANIAYGRIVQGTCDTVELTWVDVPKGRSDSRYTGTLRLKFKNKYGCPDITDELTALAKGGANTFGGSVWTRSYPC